MMGHFHQGHTVGTRTKSGSLKILKRVKIHSATGIKVGFLTIFPFFIPWQKSAEKFLERKNFIKNRRVDSDKESLADGFL